MKKQIVLFTLMIIFLTALISAISTPHAFHGEVYYSDGVLIQENLEINASVNGFEDSSIIENGAYDLVVEGGNGDVVYFYIEGLTESIGTYVFEEHGITELNFTTSLTNPNLSGDDDSEDSGSSNEGSSRSSSFIPSPDSPPIKTPNQGYQEEQEIDLDSDKKTGSGITGSTIGFFELGIELVVIIFTILVITIGVIVIITRK